MPITGLSFSNVGPFDEITFEFDQQVNVFTGPNNSGKSTVLWVLAELLVYPFTMPAKLPRSDNSAWRLSYLSASGVESVEGDLPTTREKMLPVYEVVGHTCFVPAQRHGTDFRSTGPTAGLDIEPSIDEELDQSARQQPEIFRQLGPEAIRDFFESMRASPGRDFRRRRNLTLSDTSLISNEAMIQKIIDLDYASYRRQRPEMRAIVETVASLASEITDGFPIKFGGVEEDENGLFPLFGTPDGDLPLNVLSQGTQSIIQCLAHFLFGYAEYYDFPPDLEEKPGILIIDEIDAHLHPSWQRRIIPTLTRHFPNLQIFCSTHSPLMLAGLKAGQVQLLRRDLEGKVSVSTNESDIAGWTADEILRNFLEVPSPTDLATAGHVSRLQELRRKDKLSVEDTEELERLRHIVNQDLISGPVSAQVEQFAEMLRQAGIGSPEPSEPPASAE